MQGICTCKYSRRKPNHLMPLYEYLLLSASIWRASSRVGDRTKTVGPPRSLRGLHNNTHTHTHMYVYMYMKLRHAFKRTYIQNKHMIVIVMTNMSCPSMWIRAGRRKARVFPVPVYVCVCVCVSRCVCQMYYNYT